MGYNIKVVLIVLAPNLRSATDSKVLLVNGRLPSEEDCNNISQTAYSLLEKYTGLTNNWISLIQAPVVDLLYSDKLLIIPFGCMIPEEISLANAEWSNLNKLFLEQQHDKAELEAIKNVVTRI